MNAFELTLRAGSVALESRNLREVLRKLTAESGIGLCLTDEGTLALGLELSPLDRRAVAIELVRSRHQLTLRSVATHQAIAGWLGMRLARLLDAVVVEAVTPASVQEVRALLERHEQGFVDDDAAGEDTEHDEDVKAVLALVRLGRIVLAGNDAAASLAELVRSQASAELLYEALLDADFVEDVFLSQSEFVAALH